LYARSQSKSGAIDTLRLERFNQIALRPSNIVIGGLRQQAVELHAVEIAPTSDYGSNSSERR